MSKIRCLIADDEPLAVRLIESYVNRTPSLELVAKCHCGRDVLAILRDGNIDLAFLDIQMPDITGVELAQELADSPVRVVFITAHPDYALDGFRVNALDYLLKPVSYEEFCRAVHRAEQQFMPAVSEPMSITVKSDYRNVRVALDDIQYIEGLKDYVKIFTVSRQRPLITQMTLKAVEQALPSADFVRIHRSYIVAVRHIESYTQTRLTVAGTEIPVGDTYKAVLRL